MNIILALFVICAAGTTEAFWGDSSTITPKYTPVNKRQCSSYHFNCCGGQFFHPPGQVCCSMGWGRTPEIRSGPYGGDNACCGNTTYNARVHTCCNGIPRALDGVRYKACCGSGTYMWNTEICCGNTVYSKSSQWGQGCCGNKVMYHGGQICCRGVLYRKGYNRRCCYRIAYDLTTKVCCRGKLHIKNGSGCCGRYQCIPSR